MTAPQPRLSLQSLTVSAGGTTLLHSVDLRLEPGEVVGLVGPNGAGKSTLVASIVGGSATDGWSVTGGVERPEDVAWMPQRSDVPYGFDALSTVLLGAPSRLHGWGWASSEERARARELLDALGVSTLEGRPVDGLSGGEVQRVLLALRLMQRAPLLLLDEPLSAQDLDGSARVLTLLSDIAARDTAVLMTLHDLHLAQRLPRLVVLSGGRVVADGPPDSVLTEETLRAVWGERVSVWPAEGGKRLILPG